MLAAPDRECWDYVRVKGGCVIVEHKDDDIQLFGFLLSTCPFIARKDWPEIIIAGHALIDGNAKQRDMA